jgi:hypothetical protein
MSSKLRALALVSTIVLASCGGGGGGGATATVPSGPQAVAITETNAKPVSADAVANVRNTSATSSATGVPTGVQVTGTTSSGTLQAIVAAARLATNAAPGARVATGVVVSESHACPLGGTMTISGNVASASGSSAGDTLTISMASCQLSEGGVTEVLNGQLSMTFVSGTMTAVPFHVVLGITATNLSVQAGGTTVVANGDVRLDWNAISAASETLVASGTSLTSRETAAGVTRSRTMRNYAQAVTINGTTESSTLSATIETDSTRIAASGGIYTITTPTAVVWDSLTGIVSSGAIKVVGANGSQLTLTFTGGGNATIQIDANGDGTFEKSISTTLTELNGQL